MNEQTAVERINEIISEFNPIELAEILAYAEIVRKRNNGGLETTENNMG